MDLSSTRFTPAQFIATQSSSAIEKAAFAETLVRFLLKGCPERLFSDKLYRRLSMCFGHIAHYDRAYFYDHCFATPVRQLEFLEHTLSHSCYGDPQWTFSDAEQLIQQELRGTRILRRYQLAVLEYTKTKELALLSDLLDKHPEARRSESPTTMNGTKATEAALAQTSLFG